MYYYTLIGLIIADTLNIKSPTVNQIINEPYVNINMSIDREGLYSISYITSTLSLSNQNQTLDCVFMKTNASTQSYSYNHTMNDNANSNFTLKITSFGFMKVDATKQLKTVEKKFNFLYEKPEHPEYTNSSFKINIKSFILSLIAFIV